LKVKEFFLVSKDQRFEQLFLLSIRKQIEKNTKRVTEFIEKIEIWWILTTNSQKRSSETKKNSRIQYYIYSGEKRGEN